MKTIHYSVGDVIFWQDSFELTVYDIQSGSVGIYTAYGTDQEKQLALLGPGQLLGELGMIEARPRSATAVALEDGTVLNEISEEECVLYLRDKPDRVFQVLRQLSARIRETDRKYFEAVCALRKSEEADRDGTEKSEELSRELEAISQEAVHQSSYTHVLHSSFFKYVQEDVANYGSKSTVVKASLIERLTTRFIAPEDMHANPDDEFSKANVGPNDRIISDYVSMIPLIRRAEQDIYPEPVMVHKLKPEGYLILNGHHRWAAALKTGVAELRAKIINP